MYVCMYVVALGSQCIEVGKNNYDSMVCTHTCRYYSAIIIHSHLILVCMCHDRILRTGVASLTTFTLLCMWGL